MSNLPGSWLSTFIEIDYIPATLYVVVISKSSVTFRSSLPWFVDSLTTQVTLKTRDGSRACVAQGCMGLGGSSG